MIAWNIVEKNSGKIIPIAALTAKNYAAWLKQRPPFVQRWLEAAGFKPEPGKHCLIPAQDGAIGSVVCGVEETREVWSLSFLAARLPAGVYSLGFACDKEEATRLALGWALAGYRFGRYKQEKKGKEKSAAKLAAPQGCDLAYVKSMAEAICWARDLINTPANDMTPAALAEEAAGWAREAGGEVKIIAGDALLKANYPMIHAVGKGSALPPQLVDIRFPKKGARKIALVGKGITFDSGGLDIKPSGAMRLMKKDMAGVAVMLALARTLLETGVEVDLRLLLPMAENAVGSRAMRPLDIVKTRKGITVEIGNTDAEGRLVLCDALYEAASGEPDLIIDCATLTGAARAALGTEVPAFFTGDDTLADRVMRASRAEVDPLWRLPLWQPYRRHLDTRAADLSNDSDTPYGGAITAALYLQEFVGTTPWLHIDMMAWNLADRPGRPKGGEAMAVRALHALIKEHYGR